MIKIHPHPSQICLKSLTFSRAAFSPTEGIPPAPSPLVICLPMFNRLGERDLSKACASVLMAQKDTPSILVWIIRLTALPPPPPTPPPTPEAVSDCFEVMVCLHCFCVTDFFLVVKQSYEMFTIVDRILCHQKGKNEELQMGP